MLFWAKILAQGGCKESYTEDNWAPHKEQGFSKRRMKYCRYMSSKLLSMTSGDGGLLLSLSLQHDIFSEAANITVTKKMTASIDDTEK